MNGHEPIEGGDKEKVQKERAEKTSEAPAETWLEKVEHEIETIEHEIEEVAAQPPPELFLKVLRLDLPYIVMLLGAFVGIGMATFTGELTPIYWELLAPVYGVICVYVGWRHVEGRDAQIKLVWTQAAHWLAVLLAMYVVYLPQVRDVMNNNAAGLTLMTILALATILAGIHAEAWQICGVGVILGITVPIVAWIQLSALILMISVLVAIFAVGVGASLWWTMHREKRKLAKAT
jgi:hypothetical protein